MDLGSRDAFARMGTLGIEEEFYIVDAEGRPTSGTDDLVYGRDPPPEIPDGFDHELFKCTIEAQTELIEDPSNAGDALATVREALVDHAAVDDYRIAAAGLHPTAKWQELEHVTKPRYQAQLDRIQYPQHRNLATGLHVHVGVDDADKAVWVANRLRWHCPILLALSANSPYWNDFDTGLASARAKVFENLPNTGIPSAFADFDAFQRYERRMVETDSIADRGELWFDVRPHTGHGTVEVRAPDAQRDPQITLALVEYVHALVVDYAERYEDGERAADPLRRELLDENKWRAIRHGHDASFVARDGESTPSLGEVVDAECDRLGVSGIRDVYESESGATRQRRLRDEAGVDALCADLILSP
ncbi:glutamate--cysteine ligase [Halorubrum laminariae]|uniref:Glutamate--cysteine ligase n=1 Tax=Halorubrum laminariae TaxID=1433523 RepID=A0ABD6C4V6_9EURY|nr:glutamate--cysteine ligase [Halorubrum laminariae]